MKGFFMRKNEELVLMLGVVKETQDPGDKYIVTIEYDVYGPENNQWEKKQTGVYFQNQQPSVGSYRQPIRWADNARRMNMREGSVIAVLARLNKTGEKADGYVCRYNGTITFAPDETHGRERNAVGGLVTWVKDGLDGKQNPCVKLGIYMGKDRDGNYLTAALKTNDPKLMERCKTLSPRNDSSGESQIKKYAWFKCGGSYMAMNNEGVEFPMLTAFDFTVTGIHKKHG